MITYQTRYESYLKVDKNKRYQQIKKVLVYYGEPMTAKEIAVVLAEWGDIPTSERNYVAPRLTEMERLGMVESVGKKKCQYTGRTVALYRYCEGEYGA